MVDWAKEKYVSFTTFRRDGTPVSTPVWIAPLGDGRVGFHTDESSGKVKRARANPSIEMRPCTMRGAVAPDAPVAKGAADVVTDPDEYARIADGLRRKYGWQFKMVEIGSRVKNMVKRTSEPDCGIAVTLD